MTPDEVRACLPFHPKSFAAKRLPEVIADTAIEHVAREPVAALCATWCGNQVMAGSILCGGCRKAWYAIRLGEARNRIVYGLAYASIDEWVIDQRRVHLASYGIPCYEQTWVFSW